MKWTRFMMIACGLALAAGSAVLVSCTTTTMSSNEMTPEAKIARGATLVYTSGCVDCHTPGAMYGAPDTTRQLSGSEVGWQGPWGVSYARNLTPDMETGIGRWTEAQIVTAFRAGHRPDGSVLLPPMPWPNISHMSDDDANAIAAYLKSIPAIDHKVPDALAPGEPVAGPVLIMPPPGEWDAPRTPVPGGE